MTIERHDFLVEIGTEELPPKALRGLEEAFAAGVRSGLDKATLEHGDVISYATPRRLAVLVGKLAARQPDQDLKRRGPPVTAAFDASGAPTRAAVSFADSCGTSVESLQRIDEGKGTFLYFVGIKAGAVVAELLPGIVKAALEALPIPRRMRWGAGDAEFVRPVHWLLMLYGTEVVPANLLGTDAENLTRGHRFHAPKPIRVTTPASYERALRTRGYVLADFETRRALIRERVTAAAAGLGGQALIEDALLDEVTALVEWPVALTGRFEERFLALPREVLISTLQEHQRYFPLEDAQRKLLPWFITLSNIESHDPSKVREGNERVVRPRLADAAFFWEQDRKRPLASLRDGLDAVTFHVKLGSLGDKTRRIRTLSGEIAEFRGEPILSARSAATLSGSLRPAEKLGAGPKHERAETERAAELCKCDLLTAMVGEFPELQGIMGSYYALADGEAPEVAVAIREHYLPRGAGGELPETYPGLALAIADKLDTLTGIFAVGEKPTGTKDPLGLRRAAIGILRILIEMRLDLNLRHFIGRALELVRADIEKAAAAAGKPASTIVVERVATEVYEYIMERLRAYYLESSARDILGAAAMTTEMFDAVLASAPESLLDFDARLKALRAFLDLPESASLTAANKRIANILRKSAGGAAPSEVEVSSLREGAEVRLFDSMRALRDAVSVATAQREYANALGRLAQLRPAVDDFFDQVMVMDEDPKLRANRLALLAQLRGLFAGVADLSRLPG
jgi:glycyl-tRNA synthetase beta chain